MFYVELIASYLDIHPSMNDDASDASYCGESLGCCRSQAQHYSVSILIDGVFFLGRWTLRSILVEGQLQKGFYFPHLGIFTFLFGCPLSIDV